MLHSVVLVMCMCVLVAQSYPTLCDPMDCSPPGSSVHRIFQTRILEWIAIPFSTGSSLPRDQNQVSHTAGRFFALWATRKAHSVGWESLKKRFPFLCTYRKDLVEFWEDICTHICTHWVSQKFLQSSKKAYWENLYSEDAEIINKRLKYIYIKELKLREININKKTGG